MTDKPQLTEEEMIEELKPCPEMIEELRRLVEQWYATSEFTTDDLYLFTETLVVAVRVTLTAYDPDKRLSRVETLFAAIEHGDEDHRAWLKEAIDKHFAGEAVPLPRGNGSADKRLREALEALEAIEKTTFIGVSTASEETRRVALESAHDIARAALSHNGG